MGDLLHRLKPRDRRGSKPRCHLLTHGSAEQVAARLTALIAPWGEVTPEDKWMPQGFDDIEEAQLHDAPRLVANDGDKLLNWWLAVRARTPNWDIASSCTIDGCAGLLLIEAKAHDEELIGEETGKPVKEGASDNSKRNHAHIAGAFAQANAGLSMVLPDWNLSRDCRYQMSNRFAWAWKLAECGVPVILVYLGFLQANEMADRGHPLTSAEHWRSLVADHSAPILPTQVWDRKWRVNGQTFIPLIQVTECSLDAPPRQ